MLRRPARQQGFTLIEVSLAIVIGVVILAGGISLYNQTKLSAGNSKAQERVLALASLAEEMMASNPQQLYPALANLSTLWSQRRPDDKWASPWGGNAFAVPPADNAGIITPSSANPTYTAVTEGWTTAGANLGVGINYGATQLAAAPSAATGGGVAGGTGTAQSAPNIVTNTERVGQFVYNRGPNWVNLWDPIDFQNHQFKNFVVGVVNSRGDGLSFVAGGK
jgi:prepilin-type N-terminal cleavage/methylation domain-containing protein